MLSQLLLLQLLALLLLHKLREVLLPLQLQIQEELLLTLSLSPPLLVSLLQLILRQDLPLLQKLQMAQMILLLMQTPVGRCCC